MEQIPKLDHRKIVSDQLDFYCRGDAGCQFAVRAAENSKLHKWQHIVIEHQTISEIDTVIIDAIQSPEVNQISLLFPCIKTQSDLESLLYSFEASQIFFFAPEIEYSNYRCIGLRAHVLGKSAWVSGFAPLECLPKTRQAPFTELVFRVKDKPEYVKSIQPETASDTLTR